MHDGERRGFSVKPTAKYVDDQAQHSLFRAVVGKLQYITGVRLDLLFVAKCLSYKLASPTLEDLTPAKKVLRCLKGTRYLH